MWISGPGHRSDIARVMDALREGKTAEEILDELLVEWGRNYKLIGRYYMIKGGRRDFKSEFHV